MCRRVRAKAKGTEARSHASLALSAGGKAWTFINATPDVHGHIESHPAFHPGPGRRETPLASVLLTDAEFDHTIGLLLLREGSALEVYATAAVLGALAEAFPLKRLLEPYAPIGWREIKPQVAFCLEEGRIRVTPFRLGRKRPRFAVQCPRDADWVVGYRLEDARTKGVAVYAPAIESWTSELESELANADCAFVDGTFWVEDELARSGVGTQAARDLGHLPVSGAGGSLERLAALRPRHAIYVHINNTNPLLDRGSPQYRLVTERGIEVGWDGMEVEV